MDIMRNLSIDPDGLPQAEREDYPTRVRPIELLEGQDNLAGFPASAHRLRQLRTRVPRRRPQTARPMERLLRMGFAQGREGSPKVV